MKISSIDLTNFRNYSKTHLDLHPFKNIIIGNNGTGKTNILESIALITDTKSFRASDDSELITRGKDSARVDVNAQGNRYRIIINKNGKSLFINQTPIKKTSDFIGKVNSVLFKPDDLEIFGRGPKYRRRVMDLEIGKTSKEYLKAILTYSRLLKDKNALLKEEKIDTLYLESIEERMVEPIYTIITKRQEFIDELNAKIANYYFKLSDQKEEIHIIYERCCDIDAEVIKKAIHNSRQRDLFYHHTTFGVHREDFHFIFHDSDVVNYASQGQRRLLMMSFKLALIDYIVKISQVRPILLLDDVLSELDSDNRERLISLLSPDIQTIITATDINGLDLKGEYRLFTLKKGRNTND